MHLSCVHFEGREHLFFGVPGSREVCLYDASENEVVTVNVHVTVSSYGGEGNETVDEGEKTSDSVPDLSLARVGDGEGGWGNVFPILEEVRRND